MKTPSLLLLITMVCAACSTGNTSGAKVDQAEKITIKNFSDSLAADTFKVRIEGSDLKNQKLAFTITNIKGLIIYKLNISTDSLFTNYKATVDLKYESDKIKFINTELSRFFDEENFMEPAVTENEAADENVPDKAFYEELKQNSLNGFWYRLGPDQKIYIAWSNAAQKVKTYYACCR